MFDPGLATFLHIFVLFLAGAMFAFAFVSAFYYSRVVGALCFAASLLLVAFGPKLVGAFVDDAPHGGYAIPAQG